MPYRSLITCAICAWAISAAAQTPFEFADQRSPHVGYGACVPLNSGWAVAGFAYSDNGPDFGGGFLRGFGTEGDSLWEHPLGYDGAQAGVAGLSTASNGDLITGAWVFACDFLLPMFLAERLAPDGATVWSHNFSNGNGMLEAMALSPGDTIAFSTGTGILIASPEGDSLGWFDAGTGQYIAQLIWDSDSTLLGSSGWSGSVAQWSIDGDVLATAGVGAAVADMVRWKGHSLVLANDGVLRALGNSLAVTDSLELGAGYASGELLPLDDRLLIAGADQILVLDTSLTVIDSVTIDPDNEFPSGLFTAFAATDSTVLMTASPSLGGCSNGLVRSIGMDGEHATHAVDVGISILSMDSVYYHLQGGLVIPKADATVRLTNLGPDVLNDVLVAHLGVQGVACGFYGTSVHVQDADLAQGAHLDVQLVGMNLYSAPWNYITLVQPVCIVALSPDHLYDRDQSNNMACDTAHIVLGIDDHGLLAKGLQVNNPFSNALDLRFPAPLATALVVELYDATGRPVARTSIPGGNDHWHWPLAGLSDGMYLLRAEGAGAPITRKLVRQGGE